MAALLQQTDPVFVTVYLELTRKNATRSRGKMHLDNFMVDVKQMLAAPPGDNSFRAFLSEREDALKLDKL